MSADLTIKADGGVEFFCAGEKAWHGLGTNVEKTVTWEKAMELASLNWTVKKEQLQLGDGMSVDKWATRREDNGAVLGIVGSTYEPIQNVTLGETLDSIIGINDGAHYETAGSIGVGEKVFAMVKLPEKIRVGEDISENYLLFSNSHDGTSAARIQLTNTRVVCSNTLSMALKEKTNFFRIIHCASAGEQLNVAREAMQGITQQISGMNDLFNQMAKKNVTLKQLQEILFTLHPRLYNSGVEQEQARTILNLYEHNDDNAFPEQRGTAYNMLNAVTAYYDHNTGGADKAKQGALLGLQASLKLQALFAITKICSINSEIIK